MKSCKSHDFVSKYATHTAQTNLYLQTNNASFKIILCCSEILIYLHLIFFGNKTVNQGSGANLKKRDFCKNLLHIFCLYQLFCRENAENDYFDLHLACAAPKRSSRYTTNRYQLMLGCMVFYIKCWYSWYSSFLFKFNQIRVFMSTRGDLVGRASTS